jgi:hypothetical protein
MLAAERGSGQLLHFDRHLCEVCYEIDYPLGFTNVFRVRRLRISPHDFEAAALTQMADLFLVAADGTCYSLPSNLNVRADGQVECIVGLENSGLAT